MIEFFTGFLSFWLMVVAYLIPSIIAVSREHHNCWAIVVLNVILGWTGLGWCAALVWSFTNREMAR